MPGPVPLDQMQMMDPNTDKSQSALHPSRVEKMVFVRYTSPPESTDNRAEYDAWMERVAYLYDDLHWLLQQPHDKFWCQTVFDDTLHKALDSFLKHSPRSSESLLDLPDAAKQRHLDLCRLVFMVYLRMSTHKESKDHFITPNVFGEILYENFLLDIPKMLDLCSLYGRSNGTILNKMISNIFTQQPKYLDDLRETIPTITQVFSNIAARCGIRLDTPGFTPQKLEDAGKVMSLAAMATQDLEDIVLYISDTAETLHRFIEVFPPAAKVFQKFGFSTLIASFYESVYPELTSVLKQHNFESARLKRKLMLKAHHIKKSLLTVFHDLINTTYLQPVLEAHGNEEVVASCIEEFLHTMTSVLAERKFLAAYEGMYCFRDNIDLLRQAAPAIDSSQFDYIQSAINSAFATFGHRKSPRGDTNTGGRTSPDGAVDTLAVGGAATKASSGQSSEVDSGPASSSFASIAEDFMTENYGEGAVSTPRPSEVQVESLISSVKDLFPDLGDGFIELALEELDWSSEAVVSCILEDKLPSSLQDISRDLLRTEREANPGDGQPTEVPDILESRKNVFDNDEFDIFRNKQVDVSKIHIGKKDAKVDLEDKSIIHAVKATYDAYGSMDKESMYDNSQMYDDEYDDTYDTNAVGADDADSADELATKKVLPRVLQELERTKAKAEGRLSDYEDDAYSDDDEKNTQSARDQFVADPAKLREQAEMRRQSQAGRGRRGRGGGGGGGPPRNRDVVGGPKGQGQSKEVVVNRRMKEKHKGQRNRANAEKKMSKGMF